MDFEDFVEPEVGIAVVVTAAVASPTVRKNIRRGLVYGLAGILTGVDAIKQFGCKLSTATEGVKERLAASTTPAAEEPVAASHKRSKATPAHE